jgi:uncharacterized protein (TIGR02145 family)
MNKLVLILLIIAEFLTEVQAQVAINNDNSIARPGAMLDVKSTTGGILFPQLNSEQRDALGTNPPQGLTIFNTDTKSLQYVGYLKGYKAWLDMGDGYGKLLETVGVMYNGMYLQAVLSYKNQLWLECNLGTSGAASSANDYGAYGSLFQWGRFSDGHELINWTGPSSGAPVNGTTTTLAGSSSPGHSLFITTEYPVTDWLATPNDFLWQSNNTQNNNPCPIGFRIPTIAEWNLEISGWQSGSLADAMQSPLKLPFAGYRQSYSGGVSGGGWAGYYWASMASNVNAQCLILISPISFMALSQFARANGASVRCIKN